MEKALGPEYASVKHVSFIAKYRARIYFNMKSIPLLHQRPARSP